MIINIPVFIVSFAIGIFFVYMFANKTKPIYVYPTPDNVGKLDYQDKSGTCYEYEKEEVPCENNKKESFLDYIIQV